jgi:4'-phosphopantetheinyl transferase
MHFSKINFLNKSPPIQWKLNKNDIHVWLLNFDEISLDSHYISFISEQEFKKSLLFSFKQDSVHYLTTRAVIRYLLGGYLSLPPRLIEFSYSEHGKPSVKTEQNSINIQFNLSHSHNHLIIAFCIERDIGIDIEFMKKEMDIMEMAKQVFSPEEYAILSNATPDKKDHLFFELWARKEAIIKCMASGLSYPLQELNVIQNSFSIKNKIYEIASFELETDYKAALAYQGNIVSQSITSYFNMPIFLKSYISDICDAG